MVFITTPNYVNRNLKALDTLNNLVPIGTNNLVTESQLRPLTKLEPEIQRQKDIDIALLKKDLSHIENKFNDKSHELEHEQSYYKTQVEKLQQEQENIKAKQKSLIQELESLEGRFFVSKRKKEILKELQSINNI